jgi:uncharacterized phage-associated protein
MNQGSQTPAFPAFDEHKTTEAASIILGASGGRMRYIRLLKLLYLADRMAWEEWERPITFDVYASLQKGPVPSITYDIIRDRAAGRGGFWSAYVERDGKFRLRLRDMPKINRLSSAEVDLIQSLVAKYKSTSDWDLVDIVHKLPEYDDPGTSSQAIPWPRVLKELRYSESDIGRIRSQLREEAELDRLLGA